jgi:hypothetical protein
MSLNRPRRSALSSRSARPRLEVLEDRTLPSTLTVLNLLDDGSAGSLRSIVAAASPGDTVHFAPGLSGTLTLNPSQGQIVLSSNVNIVGPGANQLTIDGGGATRLFQIQYTATATFSGLTFAHGVTSGDLGAGAGIDNAGGAATFNNCVFTNNVEQQFSDGGAIASNGGTLILNDCSLVNNTAIDGSGAAIFQVGGTLQLTNTTIADNHAGPNSIGGGLCINGATATITACTISGNSAGQEGGGVFVNQSMVTLDSTVVAGNTTPGINPDFDGAFTSLGFNLIQNLQGLQGNLQQSDVTGVAPQLGALRDNGGGVLTLGPLAGSPTLNAGDPTLSGGLDQRGTVRGSTPTIGAVEGAPAASFIVSGPNSAVAGAAFPFQVTALDAQGNIATAYDQTVAITSDDTPPPGTPAVEHTFGAADYGVFTFDVTLYTAGSRLVEASELNAAGPVGAGTPTAAATVDVLPGATTQFEATTSAAGFQSGTLADTPVDVTLAAEDAFGNVTPSFTGTVQLTSTDSLADLPATVTFTTADQGVATFSFTPATGGTQRVGVVGQPSADAAEVDVIPDVTTNIPPLAVAGKPYVVTLSTSPLGAPSSVQTIVDWGDGEVDVLPGAPSQLTHIYTEGPKLRTVSVTLNAGYDKELTNTSEDDVVEVLAPINDEASVGVAQSGQTTVVALPDALAVVKNGGGSNKLEVLLSRYEGNPTTTPVDGEVFFDVLSRNVADADRATVEFILPTGASAGSLEYYDEASNAFEPVFGDEGLPGVTVREDGKRILVVEFGADSFPKLKDLSGSVFTIAVAAEATATATPTVTTAAGATPTQTVAANPQATRPLTIDVNPATASTTAASPAVQATFQTGNTVTLALAPSDASLLTSARAGNGGGAADAADAIDPVEAAREVRKALAELPAVWRKLSQPAELRRLLNELPLPLQGLTIPAKAPPAPPPPTLEEGSAQAAAPLDALFAETAAETPRPTERHDAAVWLLAAPLLIPALPRLRRGRDSREERERGRA